MVAMNAEDCGAETIQHFLQNPVASVTVIIGTYITKNNDSIIGCRLHSGAEVYHFSPGAMDIAGVIDHCILHLSLRIAQGSNSGCNQYRIGTVP